MSRFAVTVAGKRQGVDGVPTRQDRETLHNSLLIGGKTLIAYYEI
jgi:hypothetical protein